MAVRVPPTLPVPAQFAEPLAACMVAAPLQHQDELTMLLAWMASLDPSPFPLGTIVEIGSHRGGSMELWARLALRCVVTIDLPDGVGGGLSPGAMQVRNDDLSQRFGHVHGIAGDSHDPHTRATMRMTLRKWTNDEAIDLLFIDGDHTYDGVSADYRDYAPFVRPGGIIAFHDVTCSAERAATDGTDVRRFFDELPDPKQIFSVGSDWGGIGAVIQR